MAEGAFVVVSPLGAEAAAVAVAQPPTGAAVATLAGHAVFGGWETGNAMVLCQSGGGAGGGGGDCCGTKFTIGGGTVVAGSLATCCMAAMICAMI